MSAYAHTSVSSLPRQSRWAWATLCLGLLVSCGDPALQSQGETSPSEAARPAQAVSSPSEQGVSLKGESSVSRASPEGQGLRHSTGDTGHVVARSSLSSEAGQNPQSSVASCKKSEYAKDSGGAEARAPQVAAEPSAVRECDK